MATYLLSSIGGQEGDVLTFTIQRLGPVDPFDVYFQTGRLGDTGTEGVDYTSADGALLVFNEFGFATVQVQTTEDTLVEGNEALTAFVSSQPVLPPSDPGLASVTVLIADDDQNPGGGAGGGDPFGLSVKDLVLTHNPHFASDVGFNTTSFDWSFLTNGSTLPIVQNSLATSYLISSIGGQEGDVLTFTIQRLGDADPFDVYFQTARLGDTGTEGVDYTSADGTLLVFNEFGFATVQLQTTEDTLVEGNEALTAFVSSQPVLPPSDPGLASVTVLIADDDQNPGGGLSGDPFGLAVKDFVLTHNPHFAFDYWL